MRHLSTFIFLSLLLFGGLPFSGIAEAAPNRGDKAAEQFVNKFSNKMIEIISDKKRTHSQRSDDIRHLLKKNTATRKIVIFMLGRYARKIDRSKFPQYEHLMEDYAMRVFINRMLYSRNSGTATISVVNSQKRGSREVIILSRLKVKGVEQPINVRWHLLRDKNNNFKIFNLGAEGFWIAQEQRSQFVTFIQQNGGDPKVLIPYLQQKITLAEKDNKIRDVENLRRRFREKSQQQQQQQ